MDDQAIRLRALWKSGRDKFSSFFSVLIEVEQQVGPDALPQWCVDNLRVTLPAIDRVSGVLREADTINTRASLKAARDAAAQKKREEAAVKKQVKDDAARAQACWDEEGRDEWCKRNKPKKGKGKPKKKKKAALPPLEHPRAVVLLAECAGLEKTHRSELGRRYAELKELVDTHQVGKTDDRKWWTWTAWVSAFVIDRSLRDVQRCISEYATSCRVSQAENVDLFPETLKKNKGLGGPFSNSAKFGIALEPIGQA